jgi:uncharacterized membrane protein YjfL (UPF0719 family)
MMPNLESFDPGEMLLLLGSGVVCVFGFVYWVRRLQSVSNLGCHPLHRTPIYVAVMTGFLLLAWVVWRWADQQIRDNGGYVLLVFLMGGAFLTIVAGVLPWLGISLREDAFERRNLVAVLALSGALLGVLITYAASTAGEGPSFWNNVFSTVLSAGMMLLLWLIVASAGGAAASITMERDTSSGLRLGAFLVAEGLILGRAVAGNWESAEATVRDFLRDSWAGLALCVAAVFIERALRPTQYKPRPSTITHGLIPAIAYLLAALAWVVHLGWWEGATR